MNGKIFMTAVIVFLACCALTPSDDDAPTPVAAVGAGSILVMLGCAIYAVWTH